MVNQSRSVAQRNAIVKQIMSSLIEKAKAKAFALDSAMRSKIQQVCLTTSWGFRETLLVIGVAKLIDPSYAPTTELYKCNPRALYEGPIRDALYEAGIPHRKSGPLNIAKATSGINDSWAAQRRPQDVAMATVEIAQWIEEADADQVGNFIIALLAKLLEEAERVESLSIEVPDESNVNRLSLLCFMLIDNAPAGGNTPEFIVGQLLESYHEEANSGVQVIGYKEGASVTSTTSKKPSDIIEQTPAGDILATYEITMKPFDEQRISDSEDAVKKYNELTGQNIAEIIVLCRRQDIHPDAKPFDSTAFYLGTLLFRGITYQFYEIHHWIIAALSRLGPLARAQFYRRLNDYIAEPNTSEQVKEYWKQLHTESSKSLFL